MNDDKNSATDKIVGSNGGLGAHPEAICDKCGRENVTWFVRSDLWNAVARKSDGADPMLCPVCFITEAEAKGHNATAWEIVPENYRAPNRGPEVKK